MATPTACYTAPLFTHLPGALTIEDDLRPATLTVLRSREGWRFRRRPPSRNRGSTLGSWDLTCSRAAWCDDLIGADVPSRTAGSASALWPAGWGEDEQPLSPDLSTGVTARRRECDHRCRHGTRIIPGGTGPRQAPRPDARPIEREGRWCRHPNRVHPIAYAACLTPANVGGTRHQPDPLRSATHAVAYDPTPPTFSSWAVSGSAKAPADLEARTSPR
jgi:hypothetical protein